MRVLLLTHAFNSLSQRMFVALRDAGHEVSVEFDVNDDVTREAVDLFKPDVVVASFLKRAIPEDVWKRVLCLVVHPGPRGDRGPSALDWAVFEGHEAWGVTVLQADAEMDAGDIWASETFAMRAATKASLYRGEVSECAERLVMAAINAHAQGGFVPEPLDYDRDDVQGKLRGPLKQAARAIDWRSDDMATVVRKINSADGFPGLRDTLFGQPAHLFDAHAEPALRGNPGDVLAKREGAVARAVHDGAVWIGHVKRASAPGAEPAFKLPTTLAFPDECADLAEAPADARAGIDLWTEESDGVGYLHFPFYNGAMSTRQCERLTQALRKLKESDLRVIVLMGGPDFWSNGIHLNVIEHAPAAAEESWANINAIDDFVREVIETPDQLTLAALQGNAGAGGCFMALAADRVLARKGVVLNPHYKGMGNLYGSEYWTYLLPKRAGAENAAAITDARLPMGVGEARALRLIDEVIPGDVPAFVARVREQASGLAKTPDLDAMMMKKRAERARDEAEKPLSTYREEELQRMKLNFFGFDPSYHVARYNFVHKVPKSRTPLTIAVHRRQN